MKASQVLEWITSQAIEGEFLDLVDVPEEADDFNPQTEEWWLNFCGGVPPMAIPAGKYMYFYRSKYDEISYNGKYFAPDAEVELVGDNDIIYFYRIED